MVRLSRHKRNQSIDQIKTIYFAVVPTWIGGWTRSRREAGGRRAAVRRTPWRPTAARPISWTLRSQHTVLTELGSSPVAAEARRIAGASTASGGFAPTRKVAHVDVPDSRLGSGQVGRDVRRPPCSADQRNEGRKTRVTDALDRKILARSATWTQAG